METIFALASAQGKAGVSIIRISGPEAGPICRNFCGSVPPPRVATLRSLKAPDGSVLDQALVLYFEKHASFTGEAVVEFHVHGSVAVVRAILATLSGHPGARMAEPGEFTRRALENERLDLAQTEALGDLIEAETEEQRRHAVKSLQGGLGEAVSQWRSDLVHAMALMEATIDFVEEDVPIDVSGDVLRLLDGVLTSITRELEGFSSAERIRTGFEVAIIGPPNAGKSTLLNYLAKRDAALTSDIAGTTRDTIEVRMDMNGVAVTLVDTAGIRATEDALESMGIERSLERARTSDIRVHLVPEGQGPLYPVDVGDIVCVAKQDEPSVAKGISGKTGAGVDRLIGELSCRFAESVAGAGLVSHERQRSVLANSIQPLQSVYNLVRAGSADAEVVCEDLRYVCNGLDALVGKIGVEDVLDHVFKSFCIGK